MNELSATICTCHQQVRFMSPTSTDICIKRKPLRLVWSREKLILGIQCCYKSPAVIQRHHWNIYCQTSGSAPLAPSSGKAMYHYCCQSVSRVLALRRYWSWEEREGGGRQVARSTFRSLVSDDEQVLHETSAYVQGILKDNGQYHWGSRGLTVQA